MSRLLCLLGFHLKRPVAFLTCNPNDREMICIRCYKQKESWRKESENTSFLTTPSNTVKAVKIQEDKIAGLTLEEWEYMARVVWRWPKLDNALTLKSQILIEMINENILKLRIKK